MGFSVGCTDLVFPKILLLILCAVLGFLCGITSFLLRFVGLSDLLEREIQYFWDSDGNPYYYPTRTPEHLSTSALLIREVHEGSWKPIRLGRGGPLLSHLFFADDLLLFGTVNHEQTIVMQNLLSAFCHSSGLKVSVTKTRVFFSRNVSPQNTKLTCDVLGVQKTDHLGRYLGVPLLHKRVTKDTYRYIEEKVQLKLQGWKTRNLSLAGRITLAKSALSTLAYYSMQTTRLPTATCKRIQSLTKQFIWGSTEQRKGIPLVNWDEMCQPKEHGGCGLKDLTGQNTAFLMKVAHAIHTQPQSLWVQVLRAKYKWQAEGPQLLNGRNASYLWKSLAAVWENLSLGYIWQIGNGRTTKFWSDNWVGDLGPLSNLSFCPITEGECNKTISDFVASDGHWKWHEFQHKLPQDILKKIRDTRIHHNQDVDDERVWRWGKRFTVAAAYELIMQDRWDNECPSWRLAWTWKGPHRIQTFLWLVLKGKLLTNRERVRRHLANDDTCAICGHGPETIDHVLRNCQLAKECWSLVVPAQELTPFRTFPFTSWMHANLKTYDSNPLWCTVFGIICWRLWSARNHRIFSDEIIPAFKLINEALAFATHCMQVSYFSNLLPSG